VKDTDLKELLGIPIQSLQNFKKREKDDWRYKVYHFLKSQPRENIENFLKLHGLDKSKPTS
jgi:hypothetical protein